MTVIFSAILWWPLYSHCYSVCSVTTTTVRGNYTRVSYGSLVLANTLYLWSRHCQIHNSFSNNVLIAIVDGVGKPRENLMIFNIYYSIAGRFTDKFTAIVIDWGEHSANHRPETRTKHWWCHSTWGQGTWNAYVSKVSLTLSFDLFVAVKLWEFFMPLHRKIGGILFYFARLSVFMSVCPKLNISLLLLNWFSYKAHTCYKGTSHPYISADTTVKVLCKGWDQISRSHFSKQSKEPGLGFSAKTNTSGPMDYRQISWGL